jgi:hypothetical protein
VCLRIPVRIRNVNKQLNESRPHAILPAPDPCRSNEDRVVGVVGDDLVQVASAKRLRMVLKTSSGVSAIAIPSRQPAG